MQWRDWWQFVRGTNLLIVALTMWLTWDKLVLFNHMGPAQLSSIEFALLVLCTLLVTLSGYVINDYFDRQIDLINKPQKTFIEVKISAQSAMRFYWIIGFIGFILASYLAVIKDSLNWLFLYPLSFALLYLYARVLKQKFLIGNIVVSVFTASVPLLLMLAERNSLQTRDFPTEILLFSVLAFWTNFIREIIKDKQDEQGDMQFGSSTLAVQMRDKPLAYLLISLALPVPVMAGYFYAMLQLKSSLLAIGIGGVSIVTAVVVFQLFRSNPNWKKASLWSKILMLSGMLGLLLRF